MMHSMSGLSLAMTSLGITVHGSNHGGTVFSWGSSLCAFINV